MQYGNLHEAIREWQSEVETEAAELIRQGVSPWQAMGQASDRVSKRRRRRSVKAYDDASIDTVKRLRFGT